MTIQFITLAIPDALVRLTPNANWTMTDINDYDTLVWNDDTQAKPTLEECQNMFTQIKNEKYMEMIRTKRNNFLDQTDKYMILDYPHPTPETKQELLDYRQSLRDFPAAIEDPENPIWPVSPVKLEEVSLELEYKFTELPPRVDPDVEVN